jgi:cation transport protein ChaC
LAHDETLAYLRERELISNVYDELKASALLKTGESVDVLAYVAHAELPQYRGKLKPMTTLEIVKGAFGSTGRNDEYDRNTHAEMATLAPIDAELQGLTEPL